MVDQTAALRGVVGDVELVDDGLAAGESAGGFDFDAEGVAWEARVGSMAMAMAVGSGRRCRVRRSGR